MALIVEFIYELPNGVHARPANRVETLCNIFLSQIEWHDLRAGHKGNAKSVLVLIGTDAPVGDNCQLPISGAGEQEAYQRLSQWLRDESPHCGAPLAEVKSDELEPLPVLLTNPSPQITRARTVCNGSAGDILTPIPSLDLNMSGNPPAVKGVDTEQSALENGLTLVLKDIGFRLLDSDGATSAILEAYRSPAGDTFLHEHLLTGASAGLSCVEATIASADHFCEEFARSSSSCLQEHALDARDICFQLLQQICGEQRFSTPGKLAQPAICMADEPTPSQFLELDKDHLKGLLLESGDTTSHTVILVRSSDIPALIDVDTATPTLWQHQTIYIDGNAGAIVVELGEPVVRYYQQGARIQDALCEQQRVWLTQQAHTADDICIEIAADIAHSVEAQTALGNGAEGVSLFHTETLYMSHASTSGENELYDILCQTLESANGRSIIIHTMDIGGDKPVDYLNIPAEANPFLGYRAVCIYKEYASLFITQLQSILRISTHGSLKIMIPAIPSIGGISWVKEKLAEVKQRLRNEHIPFDEKIQLGIMLEVPSVVFIIDQCCEEIDFFSTGSNNLTQYLLTVDRDSTETARHYDSLDLTSLRALDYAVQVMHRQDKWIGPCGELGAKGSVLSSLVGLGLDELSMNVPSIPAAKARIAQLNSRGCHQLLNQVMACHTSLEMEHLLAQFHMTQQDAPLVTAGCITLESGWRSKEEAFKGMTGNSLLADYCRYPRKLEADSWAYEAVFFTGLGLSSAIPHGKSEHIKQSTISVTRLRVSMCWGGDKA